MQENGYRVTKERRRAAVKAFRAIPAPQRREVFRGAGRGEVHPDPAVARAAEQWARAVLRNVWWNRLPGWAQPTASVALMLVGWWLGAGVVTIPGGIVALMVGLAEWSIRRTARQVLGAAEFAGRGMPTTPPTTR
jgi:hypothetical protein